MIIHSLATVISVCRNRLDVHSEPTGDSTNQFGQLLYHLIRRRSGGIFQLCPRHNQFCEPVADKQFGKPITQRLRQEQRNHPAVTLRNLRKQIQTNPRRSPEISARSAMIQINASKTIATAIPRTSCPIYTDLIIILTKQPIKVNLHEKN